MMPEPTAALPARAARSKAVATRVGPGRYSPIYAAVQRKEPAPSLGAPPAAAPRTPRASRDVVTPGPGAYAPPPAPPPQPAAVSPWSRQTGREPNVAKGRGAKRGVAAGQRQASG